MEYVKSSEPVEKREMERGQISVGWRRAKERELIRTQNGGQQFVPDILTALDGAVGVSKEKHCQIKLWEVSGSI
jgi:hypothetical protein